MDQNWVTWSIYVFNADGSDPLRLTQETGAWDTDPAWSPDGRRILFTRLGLASSSQLRSDLWMMNADGSDQHLLVARGFTGEWSPDGARIIYVSNKMGNYDIYTANPDGTDEQRLTDTRANEAYPSWSPDGKRIVFSATTGVWNSPESLSSGEIYIMNADGTEMRRLTDNHASDDTPRWSPDGSLIAFSSDRAAPGSYSIYVMDADGKNVWQVTHTPSGAGALNPTWRP